MLYSWRFTDQPDADHRHDEFDAAAQRMAADTGPLRLPWPEGASADVGRVLATGFTFLPHATRDGGRTISIYRGPLLPGPTDARPPAAIHEDTAGSMRYVEQLRLFDVSYAVARELGRWMLLRERLLALEMLEWRRENHRLAHEEHLRKSGLPSVKGTLQHVQASLTHVLGTASPPDGAIDPDRTETAARLHRRETWDDLELKPLPKAVAEWLRDVARLQALPFRYLVPDARMLPSNSIRLFRLDRGWFEAFAEGVLSVGRYARSDKVHDDIVIERVLAELPGLDEIVGLLLRSDTLTHCRGWKWSADPTPTT